MFRAVGGQHKVDWIQVEVLDDVFDRLETLQQTFDTLLKTELPLIRGWTGRHFPYFLKWRRSTPCVLSPYLFGVDIFVLMHNSTALITFPHIAVFVC